MTFRILIPAMICLLMLFLAYQLRKRSPSLAWFLAIFSTGLLILLAGGFFGIIQPF